MLTLFGTIIIVYFLWLVVKPWLAQYMRRKVQQKVNDMFRQAYGGQTQGNPFGGDPEQQAREQHARRDPRRKIFSRDEGEYVEFEDIHIRPEHASDNVKSSYTPREPQISDAEWEDI